MAKQLERKFVNLAELKALDEGAGGFEGYANDFGVLDSYNDISVPGCFVAALDEFIHAGWSAPDHEWGIKDEIGIIVDAREDERGLWFRSEFHPTDDAQRVRAKVKNRINKGKSVKLSIGYVAEQTRTVSGREAVAYLRNPTPETVELLQKTPRVRLLLKVKVYEVSVVSVGANPASEVTAVKDGKGAFAQAAEGAEHHGLMVAFFLSAETAGKLAVAGGEEAEDLHVTLSYCGDVRALDDMTVAKALVAVKDLASWHEPLTGKINGFGRFNATNTSNNKDVIYAGVDVPGLAELFDWLSYALACAGMPPRRDHGFMPHVTLAFVKAGAPWPVERVESLPLRLDALTVVVAGERTVIPLGGRSGGHSCSPYMYLGVGDAETKTSELIAGDGSALAALRFTEHSETVLAAVQGLATRARAIQGLRAKDDRSLGGAGIERLGECARALDAAHAEVRGLLEAAPQGKASAARVRSLKTRFLQFEASLQGVAVSGDN